MSRIPSVIANLENADSEIKLNNIHIAQYSVIGAVCGMHELLKATFPISYKEHFNTLMKAMCIELQNSVVCTEIQNSVLIGSNKDET